MDTVIVPKGSEQPMDYSSPATGLVEPQVSLCIVHYLLLGFRVPFLVPCPAVSQTETLSLQGSSSAFGATISSLEHIPTMGGSNE